MRYGKEHKQETHKKVVEAAARRFRKDGIGSTGVVDLMADVGLTHGGFYAHFASRDDLVAHAVDRMFRDSAALLDHFLGDRAGFYTNDELPPRARFVPPVLAVPAVLVSSALTSTRRMTLPSSFIRRACGG